VRVFSGLLELEQSVGTHLGWSTWHTVTQEQVDAFAATTGDRQWIHTDPARAAAGPFGVTIAHGFLTLSLVSALTWEVYRVDGVTAVLNYGADRLRFPAPVPVGARVRAGVQLSSVTPAGTGHRVLARTTVQIEGADKPACVLDGLSVVVP